MFSLVIFHSVLINEFTKRDLFKVFLLSTSALFNCTSSIQTAVSMNKSKVFLYKLHMHVTKLCTGFIRSTDNRDINLYHKQLKKVLVKNNVYWTFVLVELRNIHHICKDFLRQHVCYPWYILIERLQAYQTRCICTVRWLNALF